MLVEETPGYAFSFRFTCYTRSLFIRVDSGLVYRLVVLTLDFSLTTKFGGSNDHQTIRRFELIVSLRMDLHSTTALFVDYVHSNQNLGQRSTSDLFVFPLIIVYELFTTLLTLSGVFNTGKNTLSVC